jgi:multiple sugar transport system substrate-binding protein
MRLTTHLLFIANSRAVRLAVLKSAIGNWQSTITMTLLLLLVVIITSCTRDQQPQSTRKVLTVAAMAGPEADALKQAALDYEAQTGVHLNVSEFPYANLFDKEMIDLNARTGAYDLIMLDDPWFPIFASKQFLTEFTPLLQKRGISAPDADFVDVSIALCRYPYQSGSLYALPYVGNSQLFFYRKDLFEKYSMKPPATWDDVLTAAKTIQEKESGSGMYGYVMRAAQGNAAVADFMPIFWAFGGEMFDASGKPTVNTPEGIAALEFMVQMGKYSPPGYPGFNAEEVGAHLLQGTAAMSINWPVWISKFDDPAKSKVIGKIEFTTLPSGRKPGQAEIGNWLIAIPRASQNAEAAIDFLLWATSAEQMKRSALRGNPPTRKSLFRDAELLAKYPAYPAQQRSLETSRPRPRTPQWNEIENVFGIFLSKANSGELSPAEAMNQANAEIEKIVQRGQ